MFAWFPTFTNPLRVYHTHEEKEQKSKDALFEHFGSSESNMLVVTGKKSNDTVTRLISTFASMYNGGVNFTNCAISPSVNGFENTQYLPEVLERTVLSQKAALDSYDVPPSLLIFDKCIGHDDAVYRDLITHNKEYRYSTLTIVSDINDIDVKLFAKMNVLIFLKDRNKVKMMSRLRSVWERQFAKKVGFEQFSACIMDAVGMMKVGVVTSEGMHMIKLGKADASLVNVCSFSANRG